MPPFAWTPWRLQGPLTTVRRATATPAWTLNFPRRHESHVPNKGYRTPPPVSDRLKDTIKLYGNQGGMAAPGDVFLPEEHRLQVVQEVMSNSANLKNYTKLDRLRTALDQARDAPPGSRAWQELYLFLRTAEMCVEVAATPTDVFPPGRKLWIEFAACEERRTPTLLALPNGLLVVPVFSVEECLDQYFCRADHFPSCWFPIPRMGTRWTEFCDLAFPVCGIGSLEQLCTLATVALAPYPFGLLLNPGQRTSKFVTYPEMLRLAALRRTPVLERHLALVAPEGGAAASGDPAQTETETETETETHRENKKNPVPAHANTPNSENRNDAAAFDPHLLSLFDTRRMPVRRVEPHEVAARMRARPPLPPIAQLELHLLLFRHREIARVELGEKAPSRWRARLPGGATKQTTLRIVLAPGAGGGESATPAFLTHLRRWSYLEEFRTEVHFEVTTAGESGAAGAEREGGSTPICVYTSEDGELLRGMRTDRGQTLAQSLDYHKPLVDEHGRKPYEGYNYENM